MAAPTRVQSASGESSGTDTATALLSGVTAGNAILVGLSQPASAARTFTVSDSAGHTYTKALNLDSGGRSSVIYYTTGVAAGDVTVSVVASGAVDFAIGAVETTPVSALGDTGSHAEVVNTTSHTDASPDLTHTDAFWLGVGTLTAPGGTLTPDTGWTTEVGGTGQTLIMSRSVTGSFTTGGPWTSGTARQGPHVLASFVGSAGGGGGDTWDPSMLPSMGLLGVGR